MALRMTVQTLLVLQAFLRQPGRELYGLEISEETGLLPGTAYPILLRLENEGWVTSHWEDIDPHTEKRPPRRYYAFTASGAAQASAACAAARRPKRAALRRLAGESWAS
jgi:PadR family transcriptional regulator, regulatory protein PadR